MNTELIDESTNNETDLYAAYFKKDKEYYLHKLEQYQNGNKYILNVFALFFGIFWMMYRKLYKESAIAVAIIIGEGIIEELLLTDSQEPVQNAVSRITTVAINLTIGFIANGLYMRKAERVVEQTKQEVANPDEWLEALDRKGGVSYKFLIVAALAGVILIWYIYNKNNS